jgi:hypothetical protein
MSLLKGSADVLVHAEAEFLAAFATTDAAFLTKKLLALHTAVEQVSGLAAITSLPELAVLAI